MVMGTAGAQAGMAMVDYHRGDVVSFQMFYGEQCRWLMGIVSYHKHIIINDLECHILSIIHILRGDVKIQLPRPSVCRRQSPLAATRG